MKKALIFSIIAFIIIFTTISVFAAELSATLKRTSPSVVGGEAEMVWDIVNLDMNKHVEGFVLCVTPGDLQVISTEAITSEEAQFVSPSFELIPSGKETVSLTFTSTKTGDYQTGCRIKYVTFADLEKEIEEKEIDYSICDNVYELGDNECEDLKFSVLGELTQDEEGNLIALEEIGIVLNDKATIDSIKKDEYKKTEVEFENKQKIELEIGVINISGDGNVQLEFRGKRIPVKKEVVRTYFYQNGKEVKPEDLINGKLPDNTYQTLALRNTVPFIEAPKYAEVRCPEGQAECKLEEIIVEKVGSGVIPYIWIIISVVIIVLLVAYLMGKTSKKY